MEKVPCEICGKRFKTNEALQQHKDDAHKQKPTETITRKKKITKGRIIAYITPLLIVLLIVYGVYWTVTTESRGTLGSAHIHADFAIFLNGEQLTPLTREYFELSPYIHVEPGPGEGSVLHIHATNVPLKMFFDSLGMEFNSKCFEVDRNNKYCNDGANTLKMFVKHVNDTWEQSFEYEKYVFEDFDKILITYGDETEEEIQLQQNNITDFSKESSGHISIKR